MQQLRAVVCRTYELASIALDHCALSCFCADLHRALGYLWVILCCFPFLQWCSHCKTLTPTWIALAAEVTSPELHVAKLDATTEVAQAKRFDVRAFPSVAQHRQPTDCG